LARRDGGGEARADLGEKYAEFEVVQRRGHLQSGSFSPHGMLTTDVQSVEL